MDTETELKPVLTDSNSNSPRKFKVVDPDSPSKSELLELKSPRKPEVMDTSSNSPTKLEEIVHMTADIPSNDASIAEDDMSIAVSEPSMTGPSSPVSCEGTIEQPEAENMSDPIRLVTKEMLEEERNLEIQGLEEEEERKLQAQKLLDEVSDATTEQRYERLKYLLSKSTMYTEYLVDRIKKQKEEEEKRRQRIMQRRANKEEKQKAEAAKGTATPETRAGKSTRGRKRKAFDAEDLPQQDNDSTKKSRESSGSDRDSSPNKSSGAEEPRLLEMASTFGVDENGGESKRFINGEEVSHLQPKLMDGGVLRPYQVEGYSWLKVLYENGVNGILADEMGLGKTVQCVAILAHLVQMGIPGPFLICAPLSTIPNWFAEFKRFAPRVPTVLFHGHKDHRAHLSKKIRQKHKIREGVFVQPVVITSYEIAMRDRRFLGNHSWKYLIVDEGHRIKNTHCRLIRELRLYHSTHRLLLTGTPLQNNLAELWSLLNFLLPEIFDDKGSFETWFDATCISDETSEQIVKQEQGKNILSMLHQILTPFMLRRMKCDVDLCIPPKKEVLVYAPLTPQQKELYSALVDRTIFKMLEEKSTPPKPVELTAAGYPKRRAASHKINYSLMMESDDDKTDVMTAGRKRWKDLEAGERELESWIHAVADIRNKRGVKEEKVKVSQVTIKLRNVMMQLRKCCNHPYLLEHPLDPKTGELALTDKVISTSGKMMLLDRLLVELKKKGHRVLIFSQMTRMLDLIEDFCQIRQYDFCRLDGSTQLEDRRDNMDVFNDKNSDKFLFLLSTRAGGLGVNLTGADTVIIYDSDWNPQCDLQAQDRCHRIGQTKPVVVYRFATANTVDQKIIERAAAKRKLEKMVIQKGSFKSGNFSARAKPISPEELRELLNSKDYMEANDNKFVISKQELDALLDRSDLYELWEKNKSKQLPGKETAAVSTRRNAKAKKKEGPKSELFKVLDVEQNFGAESGESSS